MKPNKTEAIETLRGIVQAGDRVFTILRHVSPSGMTRWLDVYVIKDNQPIRITWSVADAVGHAYDKKREALKIGGCGMDMGFAVVYDMGRVLFPEGFPVEGRGRNGDDSGWDKDGGYALRHSWM